MKGPPRHDRAPMPRPRPTAAATVALIVRGHRLIYHQLALIFGREQAARMMVKHLLREPV